MGLIISSWREINYFWFYYFSKVQYFQVLGYVEQTKNCAQQLQPYFIIDN